MSLNIPRATPLQTMHKLCSRTTPNGVCFQQVLTQIGLVALRMEGEIMKPLQVPAMRDRRQREYALLAADYLCSNLDWYLLTEHLDPFTIPVESIADEVVTNKLKLPARDKYRDHLGEWIERHQIAGYQDGDRLPTCCHCFDTGADFHDPTNPTKPIHDIRNPINCTQCSKGNHK